MQTAILKFRDYKGIELESGITQKQNVGTHIKLNGANDFNGRGAYDRVDLLAPYDCKVMAIARGDNTIFFESLGQVKTPSGIYDKCWFMCTHMLDSDFNLLGMKVGKVFKQGQPCYTEGTKGIGSGNHIHMEQGYGTFNGASSPYYKSNETFKYNGKVYAQYYPNCNGFECPITDMLFLDKAVDYSTSNIKSIYPNWKYYEKEETPTEPSGSDEELKKQVETLQKELASTQEKLDVANKELNKAKSKIEAVRQYADNIVKLTTE